MKMRVELPRTVPVSQSTRVKLKWIERRRPKPEAVGSSPTTRSIYEAKRRVSSTVERLSYKQATWVRLLHPAPIQTLCPGIAQLAERAIDNREVVGSTPTPWTNFERASPSGKAPGFHPGISWVQIPPPAPSKRSKWMCSVHAFFMSGHSS
jgi:hypothetical protein